MLDDSYVDLNNGTSESGSDDESEEEGASKNAKKRKGKRNNSKSRAKKAKKDISNSGDSRVASADSAKELRDTIEAVCKKDYLGIAIYYYLCR